MFHFQVFSLDYSNAIEQVSSEIPTADLLHISEKSVPPVPLPRTKHDSISKTLNDLAGIDLTSQANAKTRVPSNGSVGIVEDFYSAPSSPFIEGAKDNVFLGPDFPNNRNVANKGRTLHLSLKGTKIADDSQTQQDPTSPDSDTCGSRPIPPVRRRSKKPMRNRRLIDQQRPNLVPQRSTEKSSPVNDSLESIESPDRDLDDFFVVPEVQAKSQTLPPSMSLSDVHFKERASQPTPAITHNEETVASATSTTNSTATAFMEYEAYGSGKLGPSHEDLKLQVSLLKVEIGDQRERYRNQLSALKSQLTEMHCKYEERIEKLESESKSQRQLLEGKLEKERMACSIAVERTIRLKEELHRYQLKYGELPPE